MSATASQPEAVERRAGYDTMTSDIRLTKMPFMTLLQAFAPARMSHPDHREPAGTPCARAVADQQAPTGKTLHADSLTDRRVRPGRESAPTGCKRSRRWPDRPLG
jgi:hypothetical protein